MSNSFWPHGLNISWNSPGQKMYWIAFPFFRGSSQPRDLNLGLPHWGQILYQLNHKGSPRILACLAYPFFSWSSQPRNQTGVSCIAGRFLTSWAIREPPLWRSHHFRVNRWGHNGNSDRLYYRVSTKQLYILVSSIWASLVAQLIKNPPVMWETWARSLDWEDLLEKGKATHSSILPWRIPWTVQSMGSQRVRHNWMTFTSNRTNLFIPFFFCNRYCPF